MNSARSKGGERFAGIVLVAAAAFCTLGGLFVLLSGATFDRTFFRRALFAGGLLVIGFLFLGARRLRPDLRISLAMTLVSLLAAAYSAETYLRWLVARQVQSAAHRLGTAYDGRTRFELVRDLRQEGRDAWPAAFPGAFLGEEGSIGFLPLGGIARVLTVACNEVGPYLVYESDERGFHNPRGIWTSDKLQVGAVGDSYAQGSCVPSGQSAIDWIRKTFPRTLTLGVIGNGPLLELAGLREYLAPYRPRIVLWFYYEGNDLTSDLKREATDPFLRRYLEPDFRQGLADRQEEIDAFLRRRLDATFKKLESELAPRSDGDWWEGLLRLRSLRRSVGLQVSVPKIDYSQIDYGLLRSVLEEATRTTSSWGGRLYFVYLPFEARYRQEQLRRANDEVHGKILLILRDLKVPVIDLVPILARQKNLSTLYAFPGAHFSPAGYRLMGDTVLDALRSDGEAPSTATGADRG